MSYPEHEKLSSVKDATQAAGEFVDWLDEQGIQLCEIFEADGYRVGWVPTHHPLLALLAVWKGIDCARLEQEKEQMLAEQRALIAEVSE